MLEWWESQPKEEQGGGIDAIALDGDKLKPREDQRKGGNGFGINEEGAGYTLTGVDRHGVAYENDHLNECEVARSLNGDHDDRVTDSGTSVVHVGMAQNTRDEVRIVGDGEIVGALPAEPGVKQQTYVVSTNSNGEDVAPTLTLELARQTGAQQANGGGTSSARGFDFQAFGAYGGGEVASTLKAHDGNTDPRRQDVGGTRNGNTRMKCYDAYNQKSWDVSFTLRSGAIGGDGTPVVYGAGGGKAYGINPVMSGVMMETKPAEETAQTLRKSPGGENGVVQTIGFKYKQSEKSQKPFAENGESQALSSGCHDSAVALGFKAGQSKDGGLGDEREVSPTLSHKPSAPEPTVAQSNIAQMRYIVRRLTPTEAERLMGLPDGYTIPAGLDANDPALVAEFQRIHDTFGAIMYDYALASYERSHREGEPPPKPPKPKTAAQVQKWLAKITDPATCPDSPRYKGCGNGMATNQPRWIFTRMLTMEGIEW